MTFVLAPKYVPGTRFTRSERPGCLFPVIPEPTPGCIYQQDSSLIHPSLLTQSFPRSARDSTGSPRFNTGCDIGPGTYDAPGSTLTRKAFTFGESFSAYKKVSFPGCDRENLGRSSYNTGRASIYTRFGRNGRSQSFARSVRQSSRSSSQRSESPIGPGYYDYISHDRSVGKPTASFGAPRGGPRLDFASISTLGKSFWL
jgi:hypothetical protein